MRKLHWIKAASITLAVLSLGAATTTLIEVSRYVQANPATSPALLTPSQGPTAQPTGNGANSPPTQPIGPNEVYIGGDVKRPGVYTISQKLRTVGQLFAAAGGVSFQDGDHYSLMCPNPIPPGQSQKPQSSDAFVLRGGDVLIYTRAAPPVPADAKLAPFTDIRWNGDSPDIQLAGTWYRWIGINEHSVSQVIDAARDMDGARWRQAVGEDLVQVLNHAAIYVGTQVDLDTQPLDAGPLKQFTHVPMPQENRRSVLLHRQERERLSSDSLSPPSHQ